MRLAGHHFSLSFKLLRDPEIVLFYVCYDIESVLRVETFIVNHKFRGIVRWLGVGGYFTSQQIYHLSVRIEYL